MPTGYTCIIEDHEDVTFEDYVWRCARAFGALVEMRDENLDAPIPKELTPSDYNETQLAKAKKRLADLDSTSVEQATALAREQYDKMVRENAAYAEKTEAKLKRYDRIVERIQDWKPPSKDHAELKKFMLQQIDISTDYDRSSTPPIGPCPTGKEWLRDQRASATRDIEYHTKGHAEELARCEERNTWIRLLRDSVPVPAKMRR